MCAAPAEAHLRCRGPAQRPPRIRPDWAAKTLAGLLAGLALALAASGLLSEALVPMPLPVRGQLAMWLVPPVWMAALSGVYFFASGLRAWLWLGGGAALAWGLLLAWQRAA